MAKLFSQTQVDFLIQNYSSFGIKRCAKELNFTEEQIRNKVESLHLKLNKEMRSLVYRSKPSKISGLNLNIKSILSFTDKKSIYIFGFLWGDGWIMRNNYSICFQFLFEDYLDIVDCFEKWGKWHIYKQNKSNKKIIRKDAVNITGNSQHLFNFLNENDYGIKSTTSPNKILNHIPSNYHHIFWRGYIDADGCWYFNEKNHLRQFSLAGSYNQDWSSFENLCIRLDIKYTIVRRSQFNKKLNKTTKSSIVRITGYNNLLKLGLYIYGARYNNIGLSRKYTKYKDIINSYKNI